MTCGLTTRLAFGLVIVAAGCTIGCTLDPNPGVYCDGTSAHKCTDPNFPYCDVTQHRCEENPDAGMCTVDPINCRDGGVIDSGTPDVACMLPCNKLDMTTVDLEPQCTSSAQCMDTVPICAAQMCRACMSGDDAECAIHNPATPRCNTTTQACVQCQPATATQSGDCQAAAPVCGTDSTCRKCAAHSECTSQVCSFNGTCADPATVLYVNSGGGCTGTTHAGTTGDPYCQIKDALGNLGGKTVVRVFPSSTAYSAISITSGTVAIIGPPIDVPATVSPATVQVTGDASNPAINISGGSTVVTLDGIEVTGVFTAGNGIFCSNGAVGPTVTITRSSAHGLVGAAVTVTNCKITMDRDAIYQNTGGGLAFSGAQYSIQNCFFYGNTSSGSAPAIAFGNSSTELAGGAGFQHNTVAKNSTLSGVAGIACNSGNTTIKNSIVSGNSSGGSPSDTGGSGTCVNSGSAITPSPAPDFVNTVGPTYDFHLSGLTANNMACCIDKITSSADAYDYDGRSRPQPTGGKFDEGAHEFPQP
jgi:hypothetical protein